MNIDQVLLQIKKDFDNAITTARFNGKTYENGNKAKEALIRSQRIIKLVHEYVKRSFVEIGVPETKIFPPLGNPSPETKLKGFLKSKNQDVTIIPNEDQLALTNTTSPENEKIISVNIRSQLSSLRKNIDTLYERTFAEALNLHLNYPRQCLGEVYLIPTHEYDYKAMLRNEVVYKSASRIEEYIKRFQAINNRTETSKDEFKYERVWLLIANFKSKQPKLYETMEDLIEDGLVAEDSSVTLDNLTSINFAEDLLNIHKDRFGENAFN